MENLPGSPIERKAKRKVRLVIQIRADLARRLRSERVETRRPVNHIVEEILDRHFEILDAVGYGPLWAVSSFTGD